MARFCKNAIFVFAAMATFEILGWKPANAGRIVPQPTNTPIPPPQPTNNPVPPTPTPPNPVVPSQGVMEFTITPISNMEHGWHIMDVGYRSVCSDAQGVVATAKMSIDAAINGETTDSESAYQALIIRPEAQFIRAGATSGTCELNICLDQNVDQPTAAANCKEVTSLTSPDSQRALSYRGQANYKVDGKKISLQAGAPGVSAWHPVFGFAAPAKAFKDYQSPLVLDLNGDGQLALTDVWDAKYDGAKMVHFDMALEGRTYPTGWVKKSDGFLAFDRNGNGLIDNGSELFGEYTNGQIMGPKTFKNGFAALATFDANHDGVIDAKDKDFAKLVVWVDRNHNGRTDPGELKSLESHAIKSVSLDFKDLRDKNGNYPLNAKNEVRLTGVFTKSDGKTYNISDVWFKQRRHADQMTAMTRWLNASPTK